MTPMDRKNVGRAVKKGSNSVFTHWWCSVRSMDKSATKWDCDTLSQATSAQVEIAI